MRRKMLVLAVAAIMVLTMALAGPAFAVGENPPTSCGVGSAVSDFATQVGGLGKFFLNPPSEAIKDQRDIIIEPVCHLDDPGQN